MDVSESEWISKAIDNVDKYLHRGGTCQGDDPQLLGGSDLLNTIGMAMGLPMRDPNTWSTAELNRALSNELVYFEGKAREAIDVIAEQIIHRCDGDSRNYVTVLPIELYYQGKLYEVPLFRVQRTLKSAKYYVDNVGRSYRSFDDWFAHSKLPPCKMAYPYRLQLMLKPGCQYSRVVVDNTPPARGDAKAAKAVDMTAAVVGIGSSVGLLFASGGLAAPLVVAGVGSAVWGTGRSGYHLIDKAAHGESVNPFENSESRMLWLGVAANLISFGAMGASMRLTSLAARGRDISNAFRVFVNVANGTNVAVSGLAILDTTIFLCNHHEDLSGVDVLMHVASIAFWTKGLFTYKTAGTMIKDAQNFAFNHINKELSQEQAAELIALRKQFKNDAQLLRQFHQAVKSKIPLKNFSQILIDAQAQGKIQFDDAGNLILAGGQRYSFEFLNKLPQDVRAHYFDIVTNLNPDQTKVFEEFRQVVNNDMNLITGLNRVAVKYNLSAREATEQVINFWRRYTKMNLPNTVDVSVADGALVLGRAPPIQIVQLPRLSAPVMQFLGDHLIKMDAVTSRQWSSSIPLLMRLESHGMFTVCLVTKVVAGGRAVVSLNNQLNISIYKLDALAAEDCRSVLREISKLPADVSSAQLPKAVVKLCVQTHRLRLECHRRESVSWVRECVRDCASLQTRLNNIQAFEMDRLYTFRCTVDTFKASPYMGKMMRFVAGMEPKNLSEMVAYSEFVVKYVENEKLALEQRLRDGSLQLPLNVKKSDWLRGKASERVFENSAAMRQKFTELTAVVTSNDMVGAQALAKGLSDADLVAAIKRTKVRFASKVSAAYHIFKHPTEPAGAYVVRANETIRASEGRSAVSLTQDGDARTVQFEGPGGACVVLERDGSVILCTFTPKKS